MEIQLMCEIKNNWNLRAIMQIAVVAVLSVLLIESGCAFKKTAQRSTYGLKNVKDMQRVLSRDLPVGTAIELAREYMIKEGFDFGDVNDNGKSQKKCLRCYRYDGKVVLIGWTIDIEYENAKVVNIRTDSGLFGP